MPQHFVSCDWGTTNLRLRVASVHDLQVVAESNSDFGVRKVNQWFLGQNEQSRRVFFSNFLLQQLADLPETFQSIPIVISGMASSSIGLVDLPYADFPFAFDGSNLLAHWIELTPNRQALIISGVKSSVGMMRGEETQALGLAPQLDSSGILILPGTHSKHIAFEDGNFVSLANFMTGELFELLSRHSVLANSVTHGPWTPKNQGQYVRGVQESTTRRIAESLFSVRAAEVLNGQSKEENYFYLSGLLIGDELRDLAQGKDQLYLAAAHPIHSFYQLALETLLPLERVTYLDDRALEMALLRGQKTLLAQYPLA